MTPSEAKKFLKDNKVKFILAQFVDIHGSAKTKVVPTSHLDAVLTDGAGFAGFAIWGMGMGPHGPDYMGRGDLSTLSLIPWMPGYARLICVGHVHGKPYAFDSRHILMKQIERLRARDWTMYTGVEPEFMLLRRNEDGSVSPFDSTDTLEKPCYDYKGLSRSATFLERLFESLAAVGMEPFQIDHEDGNAQFEINYNYSDCLKSADQYIYFKMAASEIANQLGMICTFMPKPFANRTGTGTHFHMSIGDKKTKNIFFDPKDKRGLGLSQTAYHFLGGLLAHARGLTAVLAPTVNSYKRLVVGRALSGSTWAPAYISYGDNNRTCMARIPYGRIELRLADGAANPYLATTLIIAAGLDGVERKLDPGEPVNENIYEFTAQDLKKRKIAILPQNLNEALDELDNDSVLCNALGNDVAQEFIRLKRMEWVEYQRHVSQWEIDRYLEFF